MTKLVAALLQLPVFRQDAMHRADRAEINAFIDQRCKDLRRGLIAKAFRVQMIEHGLPFRDIECTRRFGAYPARSGWPHASIQRSPRHPEGAAGNRFADAVAQLQSNAHQFSSSIWMFGIGLPNSGRGSDAGCPAPPAQIPTSGTTA